MRIKHFEPWSFVGQLQRDIDRYTPRAPMTNDDENNGAQWRPAVDIIDEKQRFVLRADVPGVAASDIDVSMDAGVLTVSGTRPAVELAEDAATRRVERSSGRFLRRFTLPDTADADAITARNSNGILEVSIPKLPEIEARRIAVEAA